MSEKPKDSLSDTTVKRIGDAMAEAITSKMPRLTPVQRLTGQVAVVAEKIHNTKRPRSGYALIGVAIFIVSVEMVRYWLFNIPLLWAPEAIAFVLGFVGFYVRDPKKTKDGAMILVNIGTQLIAVVRTGKRAGDVKAVEVEKPKEPEGQ